MSLILIEIENKEKSLMGYINVCRAFKQSDLFTYKEDFSNQTHEYIQTMYLKKSKERFIITFEQLSSYSLVEISSKKSLKKILSFLKETSWNYTVKK